MNGVVPLLKFTPSAHDPEVLETITVQREALISKLVEVALDGSGDARHQLLIGPRGMGKTHILSLVASRVRGQADPDAVLVAWLEEDPWGVSSYEKFLAAILAQVAEERSDPQLEATASELHAIRDGGPRGEQALRDALGGSRLVLLVENLDEVFRRIGDNGQERFRAFVENWQQVVVIATAPQLFEGIQVHESPFYGFFAITHLEELSLDSATELMKRVARLRGDEDLVRFLGSDVARRRLVAIEALAGGHPRIWLLLSGCVSIRAIDELVPLFLQALDDLTPYYQDRLRELGDQQQEVVVLLSEAGGALSNRALAERSGLPQNQIATILSQLSVRGYVRRAEVSERVAGGDARMTFWELREPLMRLCLDVKQARGKPLRMVVEFLRAWYGPRLLDELVRLPEEASLAATYAGEAFRMLEGDLPTDDLLRGSPEEVVSRAEQGLSLSPERVDLGMVRATGLLLGGRFEDARASLDGLLAADLPEGLAGVIRGLREVAGHGPVGDSDGEFSVLDEVEEARFDSAGIAALAARSYSALGLEREALALFRKAAELDRGDAGLLRRYGILASDLGFGEEALEVLTEVVELRPKSAKAHTNRSIASFRLGLFEEALAEAREAVRLSPKDVAALDILGNVLGELGELEAGIDANKAAAELAPDDALILYNLGVGLRRAKRYEDSLEPLRRAAAIEPENANIYANMALAFDGLERQPEALAAIKRAVELAPHRPGPLIYLSGALSELGRSEEALRVLEEGSAADSLDADLQSALGLSLYELGRLEEALAPLRRAVELDPENASFLHYLGATMGQLGKSEEALEILERAAGLAPDNSSIRRNQSLILIAILRDDEALDAIDEALALQPEDAECHEVRAIVLANLDRIDEALLALTAAIELEPENASFHARLGEVLEQDGRLSEAATELERAVQLSPDNPPLRNALANLLLQLGRLDEAEAAAAKAVELDPNDYVFLFTAAEVALARSEKELALDRLRTGLEDWALEEGVPGEPHLLCRILWERYEDSRRRELIGQIVRLYEDFGALEALGTGLVKTIPLFVDESISQGQADAWVADWGEVGAGEGLQIPLSLLEAARGWKDDRDRAHLLQLPIEQRKILIPLLEGESGDPD